MYLCGPGKHNCQPFCGPDGRFYCSDSVCSLWPAPFSYLCVSVRILCVCWKLSAAEQVKTDCCHMPAVVFTLLTLLPVSCPLTTPHHYIIKVFNLETVPPPPPIWKSVKYNAHTCNDVLYNCAEPHIHTCWCRHKLDKCVKVVKLGLWCPNLYPLQHYHSY